MINLMSQSNYFIFNKSLAKNIGIEETYMLLTLIDANNIFKQKWFFQTAEMLEELTGLKKDKQKRIIDCLVNLNIIEQKNIGIPCKRHFKINYEELEKLLMDFSKLEEVKTENKFEEKPQTSKRNFSNLIIKENNINESNINESNIEKNKKEKTEIHFTPIYQSEEFKETFNEFIDMRKTIKKPATKKAIEMIMIKLEKLNNEEKAIKMLERSIINNWQDVYEIQERGSNGSNNYKSTSKGKREVITRDYNEGTDGWNK